jgi:hypothetical protein
VTSDMSAFLYRGKGVQAHQAFLPHPQQKGGARDRKALKYGGASTQIIASSFFWPSFRPFFCLRRCSSGVIAEGFKERASLGRQGMASGTTKLTLSTQDYVKVKTVGGEVLQGRVHALCESTSTLVIRLTGAGTTGGKEGEREGVGEGGGERGSEGGREG